MSRVVGIISGKGGVGKSIVAINTAAALEKYYGKKTLLIDCNITTSHVGLYLGLYSTPVTLNDALKGKVEIEKTIYEHASGMHVIPASLRLDDLKNIDWHVVKQKIPDIAGDYDFILLDSSPGFNRESLVTLEASQEALMVTTPMAPTVADLIKCKQVCDELRIVPVGTVLNKVRNKKYELSSREVEQMTGTTVITSIPFADSIMESVIAKTPAIDSSSKISKHFLHVAEFLVEGSTRESSGSMFSHLRNLFARN